ncbi:hypothetical protein RB200_17420 [Streptomyces sp. PmtG]
MAEPEKSYVSNRKWWQLAHGSMVEGILPCWFASASVVRLPFSSGAQEDEGSGWGDEWLPE